MEPSDGAGGAPSAPAPRLRVVPPGWKRGVLAGSTMLTAVLIALAELASAWVLVVLPLVVAAVVVYHEAVDRTLRRRWRI